jgi:beta-glucosidase
MMKVYGILLTVLIAITTTAQNILPYKNPKLPVAKRVSDLLGRMTAEEKFWQLFMIPGDLSDTTAGQYKNGLFGFQVSAVTKAESSAQQMLNYNTEETAATLAAKINSIQKYFVEHTRLGIPIIAFDEALHGLIRKGSTVFPQSIGLAAAWDTALMHKVAKAIAEESRQRGIRQVLSPVINIAADVRWGRTEETYGEDSYLCSMMAVAYTCELEKAGIISTPKHFIANVGDGGRDSYPIHINERLLREIYLPPFKACFDQGGSRSVMTSYNSLDGSPATANDWLLNKLLKEDWKFNGFVISDASAVGGANVLHYTAKDYPDAGRKAIQNGLDVIFQTNYEHYKLFIPPFLDSSISPARIDDAVGRVLKAKFELGLFEYPYISGQLSHDTTQLKEHKAVAREAAVESIVLLKNQHSILPINNKIRSIAVIGADAAEARLGGYSGPGNGVVSILDGIKQRAGKNISISYAPGCGRNTNEWSVINEKYLFTNSDLKENGLLANYFTNIQLTGDAAVIRTDKQIDFHWTLYGPSKEIPNDQFAVRWTGKLQSPITGNYKIGLEGNDGYRLYINNKLVIDNWQKQTYQTITAAFNFEKNKIYDIKAEFYETTGNAHIKLNWNVGVEDNCQLAISKAVTAVKKSDMAIVTVGINEGEFRDRAMLNLPGHQEEMILQIAATGKPVIILLVGGSAVTMQNWINKVNAIVDVWYPGEEGGHAVAGVLFGDYNPSGKLPITFPLQEGQLPLVYNHKPTGRGDDYNNLSGSPLFPFGFGLSYTTFDYSNIKLSRKQISINDTAFVYCKIKNTGKFTGDEVAQLYIHDELASVARPVIELKGFQRIHLLPGEENEISFPITPEMLSMYNDKMQWLVEPGDFKIMIGSSSKEIKLSTILTVN